ncbi:ATP-grasp domain-containing protein [Leeia sp.]|uniref:ATP-grasp domain-containing protein n=1 Tax=Leeia sp. TaxID=2884678 RepID=UPI0035B01D30
MPHVLLIGGMTEVLAAAARLDIRLTVVDRPERGMPDEGRAVARWLGLDFLTDPGLLPVLKAIHQDDPFDQVLSFGENALQLAAQLNLALGLTPKVPAEVVACTRDKVKMRAAMADSPYSVPALHVSTVADFQAFVQAQGYPVILKPERGMGSYGVIRLDLFDEALLRTVFPADGVGEDYMVERFVEGPEFSVEAFSFHGRHVVLNIHQKAKLGEGWANPYIEVGHVGPAMLSSTEQEQLRQAVFDCLDRVGLQEGPSHTELILGSSGPRIVETHTRVGGDRIAQLLQLATGVDVFELTLRWVALQQGELHQPACQQAVAIQFVVSPPGRLVAIHGVDEARSLPGVIELVLNCTVGDEVGEMIDSYDRLGHVICTAATSEAAEAMCRKVVDEIIQLERAPV